MQKKWIAKCANCKMKKKFSAFHPKSPAKTQTSIGENKQELHYVHPKTFGADGLDLRRNVVKLPDGRTTHEVSKPKPVVLILNPWLHKQYKMFGRELAD